MMRMTLKTYNSKLIHAVWPKFPANYCKAPGANGYVAMGILNYMLTKFWETPLSPYQNLQEGLMFSFFLGLNMSSESQVKNQEEKNSDFSDKVLMRPPSKPLEQKDDQPGKRGKTWN